MNAKVVVCIVAGHRWAADADVHEPYPVLRCSRCGRRQKLAAETMRPEGWAERAGRGARAGRYNDAGIQRRP